MYSNFQAMQVYVQQFCTCAAYILQRYCVLVHIERWHVCGTVLTIEFLFGLRARGSQLGLYICNFFGGVFFFWYGCCCGILRWLATPAACIRRHVRAVVPACSAFKVVLVTHVPHVLGTPVAACAPALVPRQY